MSISCDIVSGSFALSVVRLNTGWRLFVSRGCLIGAIVVLVT